MTAGCRSATGWLESKARGNWSVTEMRDKRPDRRDEVAFWLGLTGVLLALLPAACFVCERNAVTWPLVEWLITVLPPLAGLVAIVMAPVGGIILGVLSLIARPNRQGCEAIVIGACCLLVMLGLGMMAGSLPDR